MTEGARVTVRLTGDSSDLSAEKTKQKPPVLARPVLFVVLHTATRAWSSQKVRTN